MSESDTINTSITTIMTGLIPGHSLPGELVLPIHNSQFFLVVRQCYLKKKHEQIPHTLVNYDGHTQPREEDIQILVHGLNVTAILRLENVDSSPRLSYQVPFATIITVCQLRMLRSPPLWNSNPLPLLHSSSPALTPVPLLSSGAPHFQSPTQPVQNRPPTTIISLRAATHRHRGRPSLCSKLFWDHRNSAVYRFTSLESSNQLGKEDYEMVSKKRKRGYGDDGSEPSSKRSNMIYLAAFGAGFVVNRYLCSA